MNADERTYGALVCSGETIFLSMIGAKVNAGTVPSQKLTINVSDRSGLAVVNDNRRTTHNIPHGKRALEAPRRKDLVLFA